MDLQTNTKNFRNPINTIKNVLLNKRFYQIAAMIILFVVIYWFVASSITPPKYNLSEGDIASVDIRAPKAGVNEYATQKLIEQAVKNADKVYIIDNNVQEEAIKKVRGFFAKVSEVKSLQNVEDKAKAEKLKAEANISLADDDYMGAVKSPSEDIKALEDSIINELIKIFGEKIKDDEKDLKAKKDDFAYAMRDLKLNKELRELGTNIGFALIKPNMVYDSKGTEEKIKEAKNSVEPVQIKKDQNIVKKGEVVTEEQIFILKSFGLLEQQNKIDFLLYIGLGIIIVLLEGLLIAYLYRYDRDVLENKGVIALLIIIIVMELLFAKFASSYGFSGFLIPVAFAAMLISILIKPRLSIIVNICISTFVALMLGYNLDVFIVAIIGGSAGALVVSRMNQRNDLIKSGILVSLVNAISILGIGLISSADIITVFKQSSLGILSGGLSVIFALGLLPFCETTFGVVTPMKLLELSNPNQPILKKLLFEAPGTYHHSIIVANLAEAAVNSIGGNSLLARVGSYYHDIGKIKRPYFFKENQFSNDNPHDKITPSLSSAIITSHVKDGLELAKKYKLPEIIADMIQEHHGTTLVKYFYVKAVNGKTNDEEIDESEFRYEGPRPATRESAVILLADSVEASVRAIPSPSRQTIEEMVRKIIKDKLEDGQLNECNLTLKDISKIEEAFLNVLTGIYHNRIEYPEITSNVKGGDNNVSHDR